MPAWESEWSSLVFPLSIPKAIADACTERNRVRKEIYGGWVFVELYKFFWGAMAWIATVAVLWPVNVPILALAYKIQHGAKPLGIAREEMWYRSLFGAGMLALMTVGFILLDYFFIEITDFPPGPIHLVIFMAYVPAAAYLMLISFAYADMFDGLGVFVIYIGLPILMLFLLNALFGLWNGPLGIAYDYLKEPA